MSDWLAECCQVNLDDKSLFESSAGLFASWDEFCQRVGESPGSTKVLGERLRHLGFKDGTKSPTENEVE